jgi:hypothetical protein
VAQPKMEWRLNHVGQMAQSVQDYSKPKRAIFIFLLFGLFSIH